MAHLDLYERLGFEDNTATKEEIKKRYRRLVKECHPDRHPDDEDKKQQFQMLSEAYEILYDEKKRKAYDDTGEMESGNEEHRINAMAIKLLIQVFNNMMDQLNEDAVEHADIRVPLFDNISDNIKTKNAQIKQCSSIVRKNKMAMKKFSRKSGESDILHKAMKERIEVLNSHLKMLNFVLKVCNRMKDIVSDYNYDFTKIIEDEDDEPSFNDGPVRITFRRFGAGNRS